MAILDKDQHKKLIEYQLFGQGAVGIQSSLYEGVIVYNPAQDKITKVEVASLAGDSRDKPL